MSFKKARFVAIAAAAAAVLLSSCIEPKIASAKKERKPSDKQAQKLAQKQEKADARAEEDYRTSIHMVDSLNEIRIRLMGLSIPCGVGSGSGESEAEAVDASIEAARDELAKSVDVQIFRFSDTYVRDVGKAARTKWEENVKAMVTGPVRTTDPYKTVSLRNREDRTYTAHTLLILDPVKFKDALAGAAMGNDEFKKKAKEDRLMAHIEAIIADFDSKYRRK